MDVHLKLLADVSLVVAEAEEAVADGAFHQASERLDVAREGLAELRVRWLEMDAAERRVVGAAARAVRGRLDALAARLPRLSALSAIPAPVVDPEQEADPEAA